VEVPQKVDESNFLGQTENNLKNFIIENVSNQRFLPKNPAKPPDPLQLGAKHQLDKLPHPRPHLQIRPAHKKILKHKIILPRLARLLQKDARKLNQRRKCHFGHFEIKN
jgi:hypothetical protein